MTNKLKFLTGVSLKRKINTKWFVAANIILAILIIGVANIDSIIKFFGGDFNEKTEVLIIDNTDYSYDILSNTLSATSKQVFDTTSYKINKYNKSEKDLKKEIKDKDKKIGIIISNDDKNVISAKMISNSYIETLDYQVLSQAINQAKISIATLKSNIPVEELNKIYNPIEIERVILDEDKKSENEMMEIIMTSVFPVIILPVFMLIIFLVQMIGTEINDEKTTRGMEIIISNVSPSTHFFSKVLSGNIFVIMQGALIILYGVIGLIIRGFVGSSSITSMLSDKIGPAFDSLLSSDFISKMVYILPLALVLLLATFLAYSLLAGILASMTTNAEDFNQLQTPIMIVSLAGYYMAIMAGVFKGSILIRICSYIPLISAILSPSLLVLGQIGIFDLVISFVLLVLFNYLLIKYGLKIYKVGILNYSSKDLWKKMFKALKD